MTAAINSTGVQAQWRRLVRSNRIFRNFHSALVDERHDVMSRITNTERNIRRRREQLTRPLGLRDEAARHYPGIDEPVTRERGATVDMEPADRLTHVERLDRELLQDGRLVAKLKVELRSLDEQLDGMQPELGALWTLVNRLAHEGGLSHESVAENANISLAGPPVLRFGGGQ